MSYASDKLYKGYLRRNLPTIVTTVKVREIVTHLPCLTDHDRETIEAKRETNGNHDSMVLLLDCLKRRENWPEQFIEALEACDYPTIAADIRREYNDLRGVNNSNPSPPPAAVIRAHVHPAPSASHASIPESGANSQAAVGPPAEASAAPEPVAQETPVQPQAPQSSAAPVPEPAAEPLQSTQAEAAPAPSTPPPSPETPFSQTMTATPPPQREVYMQQEPVENSESDVQDVLDNNGGPPDQMGAGNVEVELNSVDTLKPSGPAEEYEADTASCSDLLQPTATTPEASPPQSPSPTRMNSDVTDGSSSPLLTPEKPPVQDTTPPVDLQPAAVLQPEGTSDPAATQQVVESSQQTEAAAAVSPLPGAAGVNAALLDDNTACLSKPGELISYQSQNHGSPTILAPSSPVEPYSGNSDRLEMSIAAVTSALSPACSAVNANIINTAGAPPCQENGIAPNHNEPQENHYESPCESLDMQEVLVNVVHISEEPSILNLDGQNSTPQPQIFNGEAAKEATAALPLPTNAADTVASVDSPSCENCHPPEPAPAGISLKTLQDAEETSPCFLSTNAKYALTAAGVGACALLMAWKFKN